MSLARCTYAVSIFKNVIEEPMLQTVRCARPTPFQQLLRPNSLHPRSSSRETARYWLRVSCFVCRGLFICTQDI